MVLQEQTGMLFKTLLFYGEQGFKIGISVFPFNEYAVKINRENNEICSMKHL